MAKAYVLGSLTVKNRAFTTDYAAKVDATLPPFEGKFLVRGGTIHYEEGKRSLSKNQPASSVYKRRRISFD
mgnify:FL=1|jgi:uncharacterized protein (DUF1330 family)